MAVVAVGTFDGVHLGHRHLISALVRTAAERSEKSLVVTFRPHPRTVLQSDADILRLLTSAEEKVSLLQSMGVDGIELVPFTQELAAMDAATFIGLLKREYAATAVVLGYDTRMGSDQLCSPELDAVAAGLGLDVVNVPALGGEFISSTKIRRALAAGDVKKAAAMLGRPYGLKGVVVSGKRLGRTIGFPTANTQLYDPLKVVPAQGAYLVEVDLCGRRFYGMTNVGDIIETHILDFDEQIYGHDLELQFLERLRPEMKFGSVDELKAQLIKDKKECRTLIL